MFVRSGDDSQLAREHHAPRDHERIKKNHGKYETESNYPFQYVEKHVILIVSTVGYQKIHVKRVRAVFTERPVMIFHTQMFPSHQKRQYRPEEQYTIIDRREPLDERRRDFSAPLQRVDRLLGNGLDMFNPRDTQTFPDTFRVANYRERFEAS